MRRTLVIFLVATSAVVCGPSVDACGDKSLSANGIRFQRALAAQFPASVLIYTQPNSRIAAATREMKLQESLRQVGHTYREVSSLSDLDSALGSGKFNVVMADFADLTTVQDRISASASRPAAIGVAYKLSKREVKEAAKMCRFMVNVPSRAATYLGTITDAVRSKNKAG